MAELGLDPGFLVSRLLLRNHPPEMVSQEVLFSCRNTFHGSLVPAGQILNLTHSLCLGLLPSRSWRGLGVKCMSSEAARCWSPPCSLLSANCHVSGPSDKHITFYLGSLGEPAYRCETHFPSCLRIHRHGQSPHLVCHERSLTGAVLFIRIVGPRSGYRILNVPRPRAHLIGSCQAAAWRPGWFLESI